MDFLMLEEIAISTLKALPLFAISMGLVIGIEYFFIFLNRYSRFNKVIKTKKAREKN